MKVFYSDTYPLPLPDTHRFPGTKYRLLRDALIQGGVVRTDQMQVSPLIEREDLLRAHDADYISAFETGTLDEKAIRRIGFPWSPELVLRTAASAGGALAAARSALETGISGQLAGGTHHAHRNFGSGYCIYNDFAIAALTLIETGRVRRVAIIDLDVHQGDGNAAILGEHPAVFVFSMHGEKNFPFRKTVSDLDIPLADGLADEAYLDALDSALPQVFAFAPDLILYQSGVDGLAEDTLGRLNLTHAGLMARDRRVLGECHARGIPVSMGIGGGYADPIEATVQAYVNTYRAARDLYAFA